MMDRLLVTGGARLSGSVRISGAKNSALKLMAASLLAPGRSVVRNVPRIRDCGVMAEMLEHFGVRVTLRDGVAELDATDVHDAEAPDELVRQMRASIVVLGPLLARCGRAKVSLPGGDEIGARPVDLHVRGLERMGATIRVEHGFLLAEADELRGAHITLDYPSVTATENLLFAAARARGITVLDNAAREPEIADVAKCLVAMGARIDGAGSSTIEIEGVDELRPTDHTAVADRIEAGTWAAAAVATQGDVTIENARPEHLKLFLSGIADAGAEVSVSDAGLRIRQAARARAVDFATLPYPGIATDFQPILLAMLATSDGTAIVTENVFESRFLYVGELRRMGADIRTEGHHAIIRGVSRLSAAPVRALDIRAGAAMVIAGLCADGVTEVADMQHIDRGYEDFETKLEGLGAEVRRERELITLL
ncbi:MAG: UDP-N-acetylglucosamine 1-carboxyvinyltransferase [Actinomycetota bacterium]